MSFMGFIVRIRGVASQDRRPTGATSVPRAVALAPGRGAADSRGLSYCSGLWHSSHASMVDKCQSCLQLRLNLLAGPCTERSLTDLLTGSLALALVPSQRRFSHERERRMPLSAHFDAFEGRRDSLDVTGSSKCALIPSACAHPALNSCFLEMLPEHMN
jgi:hypothetical protein